MSIKRITSFIAASIIFTSLLSAQSVNNFDYKKRTASNKILQDIDKSINGQKINHLADADERMKIVKDKGEIKVQQKVVYCKMTGQPIWTEINNAWEGGDFSVSQIDQISRKQLEQLNSLVPDYQLQDQAELLEFTTDEQGIHHIKMKQQVNGLDVYASEWMMHYYPDGKAILNGRFQPNPASTLPTTPLVTLNSVLNTAIEDVKRHVAYGYSELDDSWKEKLSYMTIPYKLLYYVPESDLGNYQLAYHVTVRPNVIERYEYFIDAISGEILHHHDHTCTVGDATATAKDLLNANRTIHTFDSGNQFYMVDVSRNMFDGQETNPEPGDGVIVTLDMQNSSPAFPNSSDITDSDNNWNNPKAVSAQYNGAESYLYFIETFNRSSINGNGGDIVAYINVADDNGGGLDNAFWNGKYIFYGNGKVAFDTPLAAGLDVAGHEMSHGVIQATANLVYENQPGALNESFADIFGAMIDRDDWKIGEEIVNPQVFKTGTMRDMQNPNNGGNKFGDTGWQPDHMNEFYSGFEDNGGVHINSGIQNHAYYLFADAIGKDDAEQIFYRTLLNLTKSSKFIDSRLASIQAAKDLFPSKGNYVSELQDAWAAVGVGDGSPTNTDKEIPENQGDEFILSIDVNQNDENTFYLSDTNGENFLPISTTAPNRPPSVTDDGSKIYFVGTDNHVHEIDISGSQAVQKVVSQNAEWHNVAVSKAGERLAIIANDASPEIFIWSFPLQELVKYDLYNPTFSEGITEGSVQYADAVEWDLSDQYVIYDASNLIENNTGDDYSFFDVGIIRIWHGGEQKWWDGDIEKIITGLEPGEQIGNATFSKNDQNVIAFDYLYTENGNTQNFIYAANLETGDIGLIFENKIIGNPDYSVDDSKMIFNAWDDNGDNIIAVIPLASNRIQASGNASGLIGQAIWGRWFAVGERELPTSQESPQLTYDNQVYPNPFSDRVMIDWSSDWQGDIKVQWMNLQGQLIFEQQTQAQSPEELMIPEGLSPGHYFLHLIGEEKTETHQLVHQ